MIYKLCLEIDEEASVAVTDADEDAKVNQIFSSEEIKVMVTKPGVTKPVVTKPISV